MYPVVTLQVRLSVKALESSELATSSLDSPTRHTYLIARIPIALKGTCGGFIFNQFQKLHGDNGPSRLVSRSSFLEFPAQRCEHLFLNGRSRGSDGCREDGACRSTEAFSEARTCAEVWVNNDERGKLGVRIRG